MTAAIQAAIAHGVCFIAGVMLGTLVGFLLGVLAIKTPIGG